MRSSLPPTLQILGLEEASPCVRYRSYQTATGGHGTGQRCSNVVSNYRNICVIKGQLEQSEGLYTKIISCEMCSSRMGREGGKE